MQMKMRKDGKPKVRIDCKKCGYAVRHFSSCEFVLEGWRIVNGFPICPKCRREHDIYAEFEEYFQEVLKNEKSKIREI